MKSEIQTAIICIIVLIAAFFSSCSVVKGIFNAGMVWGIILVVGIIALIVYLVSKAGKNK